MVVVINFNGKSVLPEMLASVRDQLIGAGERLILFDNGSTDGSDRDAGERYAGEDWFEVRRVEKNLGFAAGANLALGAVSEDLAILANNDTVFAPDTVEKLRESLLKRPEAAIVGPRLVWPDGTLQASQRDFPFPLKLLREHFPLTRRLAAKHGPHDSEKAVDWLVGAVLGIRMSAFLEAGGFDEGFFFYHEETDLMFRLHQLGWKVWFTPATDVVHVEGAAAAQVYGRNRYYLRYIPAKLRFLGKHAGPGALLGFRVFMSLLQVARVLVGLLLPARRRMDSRYTSGYCGEALSLLWSEPDRKVR